MAVSAGWRGVDGDPDWYRWWNGKAWADAYWPAKIPRAEYLPEARRIDISIPGEPRLDIVGENWRSAEILAALGRESTPRDAEFEGYGVAELVPEPDNPHDPRALSVRIDGYNVGYFESGSADFFNVVSQFIRSGYVPTARVRVWGVTRFVRARNRDELKSAIRLALVDAADILPDNSPPSVPHFVIPRGRTVAVTGESEHFDVLRDYVRRGARRLIATLHPIDGKTKSSGQVLEVQIDGQRVGQLTPGMSASLLPLVVEADRLGRITAVWAGVSGSHLAAEVTLRAAKAEDVPESWPSESDTLPDLSAASSSVPPAYREQMVVAAPPPAKGLGAVIWVLSIIGALVLTGIVPFVGWLLGLIGLGGLWWLEIHQRRKPPTQSLPQKV